MVFDHFPLFFRRKGLLLPLDGRKERRNLVAVVLPRAAYDGVGGQLRGPRAARDGEQRVGLHANFVPEALDEKRLERLAASLDDERLHVVGVQAVQVQRVGAVYHQPLGVRSAPVAHVQLRMLALVGHAAHQNGVLLAAQLVGQHLREGRRDGQRPPVVVDKAIGRLRPLQDDVGPVQAVEGEEAAVQRPALGLEHAHADVDARIAQLLDAAALHLCKLVDAAHNHAAHAFLDNQVGAGRRLAVVGAGLQRDVDGGLAEQLLVGRAHRGEGVHLGMSLAAAHVVALANDAGLAVRGCVRHDHRPHHGVWLRVLSSVACQLQAAPHVSLVVGCHRRIVIRGCSAGKVTKHSRQNNSQDLENYYHG